MVAVVVVCLSICLSPFFEWSFLKGANTLVGVVAVIVVAVVAAAFVVLLQHWRYYFTTAAVLVLCRLLGRRLIPFNCDCSYLYSGLLLSLLLPYCPPTDLLRPPPACPFFHYTIPSPHPCIDRLRFVLATSSVAPRKKAPAMLNFLWAGSRQISRKNGQTCL